MRHLFASLRYTACLLFVLTTLVKPRLSLPEPPQKPRWLTSPAPNTTPSVWSWRPVLGRLSIAGARRGRGLIVGFRF